MMTFTRKPRTFIFSVISQEYARLGMAWGLQVERVTGLVPHFICADAESLQIFSSAGFPCTAYIFDNSAISSVEESYGDIHFPTKKAVFTVSLKFAIASKYLKAGRSVLFSDVDAIWMKNPLHEIGDIDADFIFQPGSFPENVKKKWGFSVCTGFFFIRSNAQTIIFSDAVHDKFDGDDQRTLNDVLIESYDIEWSSRPENWEHCSLQNGWTKPVFGVCRKTGFSAAALAHSYYQRHAAYKETCGHAVICHPNSPKDQEEKFGTLEGLGIDLEALLGSPLKKNGTPKPGGVLSRARRVWRSRRN